LSGQSHGEIGAEHRLVEDNLLWIINKLLDAVDSKSTVERRAGSSPAFAPSDMQIKSLTSGFFCAFILNFVSKRKQFEPPR